MVVIFFIGIILKCIIIWMIFLYIDEDFYYKNNNDKFGISWFNFEIIGINIIIISIYLVKRLNELVVYEFMKFFIKLIFKKKRKK